MKKELSGRLLKETYSAIEEAKADILGLYLVTKLKGNGRIGY